MKAFIAICPDDPGMASLIKSHGWDYYGLFLATYSKCQENNSYNLDSNTLCSWLNIYPKRSVKLLPIFLKLLKRLPKHFESYESLTSQNPCGSNKSNTNIRYTHISNEENPLDPPEGANAKKASRLPENWTPDEGLLTWALGSYPTVDTTRQTMLFKNHFLGNGKRMLDWRRTWQNWIARSEKFDRGNTVRFETADEKEKRQLREMFDGCI